MKPWVGLLAGLFVIFSGCGSQNEEKDGATYRGRRPGSAVMVIHQGKELFSETRHYSDIRNREKVTPETNFRLAGLTKQFTGVAVAKLIDAKQLAYEDTLGKWIPGLGPKISKIQVQHLLHHTSGIPDYSKTCLQKGLISNEQLIAHLKKNDRLDFEPGTSFRHSHTGYAVLATVIAKASGGNYSDFVQSVLLDRLDMKRTIVVGPNSPKVPHRARGYGLGGDKRYAPADSRTCGRIQGDDGIYSSLEDLKHWIKGWDEGVLVSSCGCKKSPFTPGKLSNGEQIPYAFGWQIGTYQGKQRYYHTGDRSGFSNAIVYFPDQKLWIVVLSNLGESNALDEANSLADRYLKKTN